MNRIAQELVKIAKSLIADNTQFRVYGTLEFAGSV